MRNFGTRVSLLLLSCLLLAGCNFPPAGGTPFVVEDPHPLVYSYIADVYAIHPGLEDFCATATWGCEARILVKMADPAKAHLAFETPWAPVIPGPQGVRVGGLRASTAYELRHQVRAVLGWLPVALGPVMPQTTRATTYAPPPATFTGPPPPGMTVLMVSPVQGTDRWYALDSEGALVWYSVPGAVTGILFGPSFEGGAFLGGNQSVSVVDPSGRTIDGGPVDGNHHDAITLPGGRVAALSAHIVQTSRGPILADRVLVYEATPEQAGDEWELVWSVDLDAVLDPERPAVLGDLCNALTCPGTPPGTEDWSHSNALAYDPADGNLLISVRNQAWVVKLAYEDGAGDGSAVWRLGPEGDFTAAGGDPSPWPTYAHDVNLDDQGRLYVYDNGNVRCDLEADCESRGQVWELDELSMVATPVLNVRLGVYQFALGGARPAPGGGVFTSGLNPTRIDFLGFDPADDSQVDVPGLTAYRAFWRRSLYAEK